jgi:antitoxin (DNA-binding transcriptional repressor) of toxin-antitoxin stability system
MKTATLEDLRNNLDTIIGWVEQGEDVVVEGEPVAKSVVPDKPVNWSKSAVYRRPPGRKKIALTAEELQEFYREL